MSAAIARASRLTVIPPTYNDYMEKLNISVIVKRFSDESAAWECLEEMRWPNGPVCPHCGVIGTAYFIQPKNGHRTTSTGKVSYRRLWKCADCRKPFSVLVGTIFERSQVPLSKWLLALYMMSASKNGVAAFEIHRTLGVTNKTAWFMMMRIREAMKRGELAAPMVGTIVADETYIGGKKKNQHQQGRKRPNSSKGLAGHQPDKTAVLSLVNKRTGEVRSRVVANVEGPILEAAIREEVQVSASILHTDKGSWYNLLGTEFKNHHTVDHHRFEFVRGDISTNQAENYFGQLKRSIDGTHHRVSRTHLPRYLAEFDFRYSTRKMSDTARMEQLVSQTAGRRLTYESL